MRGGYGRSGPSLGERTAAGNPVVMPSASAPASVSPARHCTVDGEPSLLVEWCRTETGWEGRVISVLWLDAVGWATVERWLPAARIVQRG